MFIESLQHRYATKKFDNTKTVRPDQLDRILEAGRLAPSSYGLQPYRFMVISKSDHREELQKASFNQPQLVQASHVILVQAKKSIDVAFVDSFIELIATERSMPIEALADYKGMIMSSIVEGQLVKDVFGWTQKQAYIALGFMLFAAALENVDACPMEGFIAAQVDELVGTHPDYQTVTLLPLGHRDADDAFSQYKKVRWPHQEIIIK